MRFSLHFRRESTDNTTLQLLAVFFGVRPFIVDRKRRNEMKKIIALMMVLLMTAALAACAGNVTETVYDDDKSVESTKEAGTAAEKTEEVEKADDKQEEKTEAEEVKEEAVEEVSVFPYTFTDKFGSEVVIESAPETAISMSPEVTEIIFALGAGDKLVGKSSYCNYPEAAADIQDYGTLFDLNIETIVAAAPDVIFVSSMASEEIVNTLKDQELTVVALDKDGRLDGTYDYIEAIGQVFGMVDEAVVLNDSIKAQIADVEAKVADLEAPTAYYVVWAGGGYDSTATGDTFVNDMIVSAGGDNVAKDGSNWMYTVEQLVEHDPYIVVSSSGVMQANNLNELEGYMDLTAVKEGRLYEVNQDIFSRQGPRIGEAVRVMAEIFHPEAFK